MNTLVLKITGKAFDSDFSLLKRYVETLRSLLDKYKLLIVTGGGTSARKYMDIARSIGVKSNYWLDRIGILVSRLNGLLLVSALSDYAYPRVAESIEEALEASGYYRLVITGGISPGQSTATVLLQIAEAIGAKRVYYYSATGKVYNKDPAKYANATPLSTITVSELLSILDQSILPGEYALIDSNALRMALRSNIEIWILDYRAPEQIYNALQGINPGTVIIPK